MDFEPPYPSFLNRSTPLSHGLAAHWPINEKSGGVINDVSGTGKHGTMTNMDSSTDRVPTTGGYCLDFSTANNQKIVIPTQTLIANWTLVFEVWGGTNGTTSPTGAMVCGDDTDGDNFIYMIDDYRLRFENSSGANETWTADVAFYHSWRHVVLRATSNTVEPFLDGVSQGLRSITPTFVLTAWGTGHTTESYDFNGRLRRPSLFSRPIATAEIQELYLKPYILTQPPDQVFFTSGGAPPAFGGANSVLGGGIAV
jgi:hypothetical protein